VTPHPHTLPHVNSGLPTGVPLDLKVADVRGNASEEPPTDSHPGKMIQPWYVLGFVSLVIGILALIAFFYPDDGIPVGEVKVAGRTVVPEFSLYFPSWADFFEADTNKPKDLDEILAALGAPIDPKTQAALDTTDEFRKAADMKRPPNSIQYPNDDPSVLFPAFEALEKARNEKKPVRILHYGGIRR
jgi:hypothetical protein